MRCLNQVLLRASLGVLILAPCAYGRSVRMDHTAMLRSESSNHFTLRHELRFSGKSVFVHVEPRAVRGSVHIIPGHITLSHNGHGTGVSTSDSNGSSGSGGNWGNGSNPGPSGNNWNGGSNPGPGENTVPGGYSSVPEGGATASYLVPAGFVAFGGIFLAGFRRQDATF
jgi:hypothetical protein